MTSAVSGVTASISGPTAAAGGLSGYTVGFTATVAIPPSDSSFIYVQFPAGTGLRPVTYAYATDDTTGQQFGSIDCTYGVCNGTTFEFPIRGSDVVNAGDHVTMVVNGAINPSTPGSYQVQVSTTSDVTPATSTSYIVFANNPVSNVTAAISGPTPAAGGLSGYTVGFNVSATGGLSRAVGSSIYVQFPAGTGFQPATYAYATDDTTGQQFGSIDCTYGVCNGTTFTFPIGTVNAGDHVTMVVNGAINPSTPASYQVQVSTTSDVTPVTSTSYTVVANNPVSHVTASASSSVPSAQSNYTVGFNASATGGLSRAVGSSIYVQFPAGTGLQPATYAYATDDTTGQQFGSIDCTYGVCNGTTFTFPIGTVNAGDHVTMVVNGALNPPNPGASQGQVSTSSDPTPVAFSLFGALTRAEEIGGGLPALQCSCRGLLRRLISINRPINTATGEFYHQFNDLSVPGRGQFLAFSRTYSSSLVSGDSPSGFGWTDNYNMFLSTDQSGNVTVHELNGSQVTFALSNGVYTPPSHDLATLVKNPDGTFIYARDADQVKYVFSAAGQLISVTDRNGYVTALSYSGGQLQTVTDPAGRTLTFTYTGSHIASVTDPAGRIVKLSYDPAANLATATDVAGGLWSFTYDSSHRMLTMTDPRGGVTKNVYDPSGQVTSQTDPMRRKTKFSYTTNPDASATTLVTDPLGKVTRYDYRNLLLTAVTRGYGSAQAATTTYTYDPTTLGVASVTDPNGHTTTSTYDAQGNLLTKTDGLGHETVYTYNSFNQVLTVTDPLAVTTTNTYDANGNLLTTSTPIGPSTATTIYTYGDSSHPGDVTSITDPNGHTWNYSYDTQGDRASVADPAGDKTTYTYNTIGERLTMVSPKGNTTSYTYNPFGDLATVTDPLGHTTTNSYDADRNLVTVKDANGNVTRNTYDRDNEPTKSVRSSAGQLLQTLVTSYDSDSNVLAQINGLGIATETYSYDPLNRVASAADGLGRATTYTYDGAGNRLTLVDPSGRTTTFSYDAANELTGVAYSDGSTPGVTYTYDDDGQRLTMTDAPAPPGTGTTTYTYDALHRLTKDVQGDSQTVYYGYDLAGNLTKITYPSGKAVTRTYDPVNRLTVVATWLAAPNKATFVYDLDSNLTKQKYPNGVVATFSYDRADRLRSITDAKGGTTLQGFAYARNRIDLVTAESSRSFGYDGLNRLTADSLATTAYTYDAADELTKLTTSTGATILAYDNANQLTSSTVPAGPTTYIYDSQGNRATATPPSGSPASYTYDQANRLEGVRFSV